MTPVAQNKIARLGFSGRHLSAKLSDDFLQKLDHIGSQKSSRSNENRLSRYDEEEKKEMKITREELSEINNNLQRNRSQSVAPVETSDFLLKPVIFNFGHNK